MVPRRRASSIGFRVWRTRPSSVGSGLDEPWVRWDLARKGITTNPNFRPSRNTVRVLRYWLQRDLRQPESLSRGRLPRGHEGTDTATHASVTVGSRLLSAEPADDPGRSRDAISDA